MRWLQAARRQPGRPWIQVIFVWSFIQTLVFLYLQVLYRILRRGAVNVPSEGPLIFISNHQSYYDPTLVGVLVRDRPFTSMARASLFRRLFGWLIRCLGAIPVERGGRGDRAAIKTLLAELEAGRCILMFPEGTRTGDGTVGPFQPGVLLMIKRSRARVVPVAVEGVFDVWPRHRSRPRWSGRMAVKAAAAIEAEELLRDGSEAAVERMRREVETLRLELRAELRRRTGGRYPAPGPADEPYWVSSDSNRSS